MDQPQPTTPPRPTIPVPPNAPKKPSTDYTDTCNKGTSASRILVLE
jgi:hypothetical protein